EIPDSLSGEVTYIGRHNTLKFDIENIKKHPDVLAEGTEVVYEEKLHGTCFLSGIVPGLDNPDIFNGEIFVTSKGMSAQGLVLKCTDDNMTKNVYMKAFMDHALYNILQWISYEFDSAPVYIL